MKQRSLVFVCLTMLAVAAHAATDLMAPGEFEITAEGRLQRATPAGTVPRERLVVWKCDNTKIGLYMRVLPEGERIAIADRDGKPGATYAVGGRDDAGQPTIILDGKTTCRPVV